MTELLQKAIAEVSKLSDEEQDQIAAWILERLAVDEDEWESQVLTQSLGDALHADGSIDYDMLRARGKAMTLDEFYPEGNEDDDA